MHIRAHSLFSGMKSRLIHALVALLLACLSTAACAVDVYDSTRNQLSIPYVSVGGQIYTNVVITVGSVLAVNGGTSASNYYDSYDATSGRLSIPSVTAFGTNYTNVVITVGNVISVGGELSTLGQRINGFLLPYFMQNGITAATVVVMKGGNVIHQAAFGYQDAKQTIALPTTALMTGASIVKPVTAAGIQNLASAGKLQLTDAVFCPAGVSPSTSSSNASHCWVSHSLVGSTDASILNITITDLLAHEGGWNRAGTACYPYQAASAAVKSVLQSNGNPCDIIQLEAVVQGIVGAQTGKSPVPPVLANDIQVLMLGALDYPPGGTVTAGGDRYSNFGYMLLGYIIEQASGTDFNTFINNTILAPIGVSSADFKTSASLLANADPREPNYITTRTAYSVFFPGTVVNARDGAINAEDFKACATTMMTAKAMATFAQYYKIDAPTGIDGPNNGVPLNGTTNTAYHRGDLPGTAAILRQLSTGESYAVLMNKNDRYENANPVDYQTDVMNALDAAINASNAHMRK